MASLYSTTDLLINMFFKNSSGNARLNSVSGDITGKIDSDEVEVSLVSGDITLHLKEFRKLNKRHNIYWIN